jgi:AraC-like DNA-binding protein
MMQGTSGGMILEDTAARFWQPAPGGAAEFLCARLESGASALHVHDEWQFAVADGLATLSVGAFGRYAVQPGDVCVTHPYDVHEEVGGPSWRLLYVAPRVMTRLQPALREAGGTVLHDPAAAEELRALLRESEGGYVDGPEFVTRACEWLRHLLQRSPRPSAVFLRARRVRPVVARVQAYLRARPTEAVSLSDAVAIAGVAPSRLVRTFSRDVGLPPKSYHTHVRLAVARRLLVEGKSCSWVAYECGFADQSHLSRRFKQCYGLTPGVFQAQCSGTRFAEGADSPNKRVVGVDSHAA